MMLREEGLLLIRLTVEEPSLGAAEGEIVGTNVADGVEVLYTTVGLGMTVLVIIPRVVEVCVALAEVEEDAAVVLVGILEVEVEVGIVVLGTAVVEVRVGATVEELLDISGSGERTLPLVVLVLPPVLLPVLPVLPVFEVPLVPPVEAPVVPVVPVVLPVVPVVPLVPAVPVPPEGLNVLASMAPGGEVLLEPAVLPFDLFEFDDVLEVSDLGGVVVSVEVDEDLEEDDVSDGDEESVTGRRGSL